MMLYRLILMRSKQCSFNKTKICQLIVHQIELILQNVLMDDNQSSRFGLVEEIICRSQ